jgi:phosphopantetheine--protein transferase-like protein
MQDQLRTIVAELLQVSADKLSADSSLVGGRLGESMGRALLDAALRRRMGTQSPAVYTAKNFGELEAAINGKTTSVVAKKADVATIPVIASTQSAVGCGVDIQSISDLPATDDYWEHEFYKTHFTKTEIGYCLLQSDPRVHFAGRWCAKEALKKCDAAFLGEEMNNLEIISDNNAPTLFHIASNGRHSIPYALSISHTTDAAVAVVIRATISQSPDRVAPAASTTPAAPPPKSQPLGLLLCCIASVLLSAFALWVAFHR